MAVEYPGHWLRTRRQAAWQNVALLMVLLPLSVWRASTQPLFAGTAVVLLTLGPFVLAYQAMRVLEAQERVHDAPTPEMCFIFRAVVNTPLTFGSLMLVVLTGLR